MLYQLFVQVGYIYIAGIPVRLFQAPAGGRVDTGESSFLVE